MKKLHAFQFLLVLALLSTGFWGFRLLRDARTPPGQNAPEEIVVEVEAFRVRLQDIRANLHGFGTAEAHRRTMISAEVSGRVVEVHPNLEDGEIVQSGELLLKIDPRNYQSALNESGARVDSLEVRMQLLQKRRGNARRRIKIIRRDRDLALNEYERFQKLVGKEGVESQSRLDKVEQAYTKRQDQLIAIENSLSLIPIEISQIQADLESARAQLDLAMHNLERTSIVAPFTGRVNDKQVELGMQVMQTTRLLTLIDDSMLEIPVSLRGAEVLRWLPLDPLGNKNHWFDDMPEITVEVCWVENQVSVWAGKLERVRNYGRQSRQLTLIIGVATHDPVPQQDLNIPLIEGMFCEVNIPGRIIEDAFLLPRESVSHDGRVLLVDNGKIRSRKVGVIRHDGDHAVVREGLTDGDTVITSRPGISLDGTRVNVRLIENPVGEYQSGDAEITGSPLEVSRHVELPGVLP